MRYKLIAIIIGITMALVFAELALRIYNFKKHTTKWIELEQDKDLIYAHKSSIIFTNKFGVKIKYNSLGFIGEDIARKKEGTFRMLGIGDSITAAEYLPDNLRYLNRMGKVLEDRTNKKIEVINGGVDGYNTWQELALIKKKGFAVSPDLIIVGICQNDFGRKRSGLRNTFFNMITEDPRDGSRARYLDFVYQRSDLYKFLYDSISNFKRSHFAKEDNSQFSYHPTGMNGWQRAFLDIYDETKKHNTELLFVIFPMEQQIANGENFSCKQLMDFFREKNIDCIDLIDCFKNEAKKTPHKKLFIERDNLHPNDEGHRISAQAIADYIIAHHLVK